MLKIWHIIMSNVSIFTNPGQNVSLVCQVINNNGTRVDGYAPSVESVIFPDLVYAAGFPQTMQRIGVGLYLYSLVIPTGPTSLGTFIASIRWTHPDTSALVYQLNQIQVALPFGNSSVSPG